MQLARTWKFPRKRESKDAVPMMEFKILGPPELSGSGPHDMKLSPQLWCVVASLLMTEGKPVPVDSLTEHLWGWDAPPTATGTVRTYVSRESTRSWRTVGFESSIGPAGTSCSADPQAVDLHRFRFARSPGRVSRRKRGSRPRRCAAEAGGRAVAGTVLDGAFGEWVSAQRHALDEERLRRSNSGSALSWTWGARPASWGNCGSYCATTRSTRRWPGR